LLSAAPEPDPKKKKQRIILTGDIPSPAKVPTGCYFHPRCPKVQEGCKTTTPQLASIEGNPSHEVSCILYPTSLPKPSAVQAA